MSTAVKKGLAAIRAQQEENARRAASADRVKADWLKIPANSGVKLRFLQELDEEAEGYNEEAGLGLIAIEHNAAGAEGYKRRGLCTIESQGRCYPCERHRQEPKAGWRQKQNLYINVLVDYGNGEKKVAILPRNANSAFATALIEYASDNGTITNVVFSVKRTGEGTSTNWSLMPVMNSKVLDEFPLEGHELFDLEDQLREVNYDDQPKFYSLGGEPEPVRTVEPAAAAAAAADDW